MKTFILILSLLILMGCESAPEKEKKLEPIDDSVWETTDEQVKILGCEEWKERNPEADC